MNVFISYRRADTKGNAGRLADRLNEMPGIQNVFIDVDGIEPGINFINKIDEALNKSDVCLILIGKNWMDASSGNDIARIHEDGDFVRREVAGAINSGKKVIPVLVDDALMPLDNELPADLQSIVSTNAVFLRHGSFDQDFDVVVDAIFSYKPRTPLTRFFKRHPIMMLVLKIVGGMIAAGILLLVLTIIHNLITGGRALSETLGSQGLVWLIIIGVFAAGGIIPAWRTLRR